MYTKVMVDPVNLPAKGVSVSEELHKMINIGFSIIKKGKIGTAS